MKTLTWISLFLIFSVASAKRSQAPFLYPLDDGTYRFVVRENGDPDKRHVYKGGHIAAYLKMTGEKLWERYLYKVRLDPQVEADVQGVFIRQLYLDEPHRLVVQNDRGEWFVLDKRTGESLKADQFKRKGAHPTEVPSDSGEEGGPVDPVLKGDLLVEADPSVSYGHQKIRAYDVPTGRLLWEKKVNVPKGMNGGRSAISFFMLDDGGRLEVSFDDSSVLRLDGRTGKGIR